MSTAPHDCDRPESAGHTDPWRCPACGMLWEPLPPEPVEQPTRAINKRVIVALGVSIAGAGMVAGSAVLLPPPITVGVVFVVLIAVVAHWQAVRP